MTIEILSAVFVTPEVSATARIDMRAVLLANGMWLVLEGFTNGYASTEAGVDRLHTILHDTIQPESAVIALHEWLHVTRSEITSDELDGLNEWLHVDLPVLFN